MQIEHRRDYSSWLDRYMEYNVYGHQGKPIIVFPTSFGHYDQWEGMGMIDALAPLIDAGEIQVWTIDGMDTETVKSVDWDKLASINRYDKYMGYIREELMPNIMKWSKWANSGFQHKALVTGASLGAFHAANFFFHQPWHVDGLIALSGVYSTRHAFGDYMPDPIAAYSPLDYLQGTFVDERWLAYQRSRIILACGQGAWEEPMLTDTRLLGELLASRQIPAWVDIWGYDVNHDWPWWRVQLPYFLNNVLAT